MKSLFYHLKCYVLEFSFLLLFEFNYQYLLCLFIVFVYTNVCML